LCRLRRVGRGHRELGEGFEIPGRGSSEHGGFFLRGKNRARNYGVVTQGNSRTNERGSEKGRRDKGGGEKGNRMSFPVERSMRPVNWGKIRTLKTNSRRWSKRNEGLSTEEGKLASSSESAT